jgi:hypothetical protein
LLMFVADRACKVQGERTSGQAGQVLDMGYGRVVRCQKICYV